MITNRVQYFWEMLLDAPINTVIRPSEYCHTVYSSILPFIGGLGKFCLFIPGFYHPKGYSHSPFCNPLLPPKWSSHPPLHLCFLPLSHSKPTVWGIAQESPHLRLCYMCQRLLSNSHTCLFGTFEYQVTTVKTNSSHQY